MIHISLCLHQVIINLGLFDLKPEMYQ